eukprot:jgi/Picsp_1/6409/NSC_03757-R1_---NA---
MSMKVLRKQLHSLLQERTDTETGNNLASQKVQKSKQKRSNRKFDLRKTVSNGFVTKEAREKAEKRTRVQNIAYLQKTARAD